MKYIICTLFFIISCYTSFANPAGELNRYKKENCSATREYVTALEYLRDKKSDFQGTPQQNKKIADRVSKGCNGSAARFIKITRLLVAADVATKTAIRIGERFALNIDEETNAFVAIFKKVFLKKYLDLSVTRSLQLALSLSIDFKGKKKHVLKDFKRLVRFCVTENGLDLPRPKCAKMAVSITKLGQGFDDGVSEPFIGLFYYLAKESGLTLPTYKALDIAREAIKFGPMSKVNFVHAYKYATSKNGLDLSNVKALNFAANMASRSSRLVKNQNE